MLKNKRYFAVILLLIILNSSCNNPTKKNNEIAIDSIDKKLIYRSEYIAEGILKSFNNEKGVENLLLMKHITPILYAGIKKYKLAFKESYLRLNPILGELTSPVLIKVVKKPHLKSFRYGLTSSNEDISISSVTLILDINVDYNLANFYLMVTSKDGKLNNQSVLPKIYMQI